MFLLCKDIYKPKKRSEEYSSQLCEQSPDPKRFLVCRVESLEIVILSQQQVNAEQI